MSDYGCCTLSVCVYEDEIESCDDCPFYDKDFFRENINKERKTIMNRYLVKGKVCENGNWRNVAIPVISESVDMALQKAKWKYRDSEKIVIKSVYMRVWQGGRKNDSR